MGCLRLVVLKIIGLFCRIYLFYRALLQKRPKILRNLLIEATGYPFKRLFSALGMGSICSSPVGIEVWVLHIELLRYCDRRVTQKVCFFCVLQCVTVCCRVWKLRHSSCTCIHTHIYTHTFMYRYTFTLT